MFLLLLLSVQLLAQDLSVDECCLLSGLLSLGGEVIIISRLIFEFYTVIIFH